MTETKRKILNVICWVDILLGVFLIIKGEIPVGLLVIAVGVSIMTPKEDVT